ncbi:MAG: hypothetical protein RL710_2749 [Pseudomonadota bacterium]
MSYENMYNVSENKFSPETLHTVVGSLIEDMKNITNELEMAMQRGTPTKHWSDRLRQSSVVLCVAMKEMQELAEQP